MLLQFNYFLKNDFGLLLMLFWLFSLAMTSFSYTLSVLVRKPQGAMYLGFTVFIVGWMFQVCVFFGGEGEGGGGGGGGGRPRGRGEGRMQAGSSASLAGASLHLLSPSSLVA
jgi:hypothetical protein